MKKRKICITTDCACDLSEDILRKNQIDLMYFYIETETGRFRDVDEITSKNIFEYLMNDGKRTETKAPPTEEFQLFFTEKLQSCDEIIHIAISSKISMCVKNSTEAVKQMGEDACRVHIFDSLHLSTGLGLLVLKAVELANEGYSCKEILSALTLMREKVSTTFMTQNADYLYRNAKVSKNVKILCSILNIHPILKMENGYIKLKSIQIGGYEESAMRYIKKELRHPNKIAADKLFITHAGCSINDIKLIRHQVDRYMHFESVMITNASATISGNSGPRTFGLLFVRN